MMRGLLYARDVLTDLDFSRYREDWPDHFETARKRLEGLVPKACQIHHVGSTAVPGLSAKDCIDILIQVPCVEDLSEVVTVLQESGYDHRSESFAEDPRRSFLRLVRGDKRVEHVHVVTLGHPSGEEQLAMRDFLRAEPQARHALLHPEVRLGAQASERSRGVHQRQRAVGP